MFLFFAVILISGLIAGSFFFPFLTMKYFYKLFNSRKPFLLFLLLFSICGRVVYALPQENSQSLRDKFDAVNRDALIAHIDFLVQMADDQYQHDPVKALNLAREAMRQSDSLHYTKGQVYSRTVFGEVLSDS